MAIELLKNVFCVEAHWIVNKRIAREVGIEATVLLMHLTEKYIFYHRENELVMSEGTSYFFATSKEIERDTTLGYRAQKNSIETLTENGLIRTKLMSTPAKIHFSISEQNIVNLLNSDLSEPQNKYSQNRKTSISETRKLVLSKRENTYKEIILRNNINFFYLKENEKIFQKNTEARYEYEKENYIMFADKAEFMNGKIIVPEIFLIAFLEEQHPTRFEGMLRKFDGRIEEKTERFLTVAKVLFKERSSSTFEDIDHFINTIGKINRETKKTSGYKPAPATAGNRVTHVKGQDNYF